MTDKPTFVLIAEDAPVLAPPAAVLKLLKALARGGLCMTTYPDRSKCWTNRSAVICVIAAALSAPDIRTAIAAPSP